MSKRKIIQRPAPSLLHSVWLWGALAIVLVVIAGVVLVLQKHNTGASASTLPPEISVTEAAAKRAAGAFILDVRQPEEWNQYHIAGATLIPLGELAAKLSLLPRDQEIVVVCHSGNRSAQGRDILRTAGFTRVTSMTGGLIQWQASGYPTVSGP